MGRALRRPAARRALRPALARHPAAVATLLLPAGLAALFAAAGSLLRPAGPSALHLGGWVAFSAAFGQLSASLAGLVGAATRMLAVLPAYERARPILQAPPECVTQPGGAPLVLQGAIEFTSVTFAYDPDTPPVLQDLTLSIQRSVSRLDPTEAVLAEGFLGFLRGEGAGSEGRVYRQRPDFRPLPSGCVSGERRASRLSCTVD